MLEAWLQQDCKKLQQLLLGSFPEQRLRAYLCKESSEEDHEEGCQSGRHEEGNRCGQKSGDSFATQQCERETAMSRGRK
jgi:hypothetical protein